MPETTETTYVSANLNGKRANLPEELTKAHLVQFFGIPAEDSVSVNGVPLGSETFRIKPHCHVETAPTN